MPVDSRWHQREASSGHWGSGCGASSIRAWEKSWGYEGALATGLIHLGEVARGSQRGVRMFAGEGLKGILQS